MEVSPKWYIWLKWAWKAHYHRTDLAGISLMRQTLIPDKSHKSFQIHNNHKPFLFRLLGSIGFSPHPIIWTNFLIWLKSIDISEFDVSVDNLITSDWYRSKIGKTKMWEQHFIYFCKVHDLYTLYINLPHSKTLASNMRE